MLALKIVAIVLCSVVFLFPNLVRLATDDTKGEGILAIVNMFVLAFAVTTLALSL